MKKKRTKKDQALLRLTETGRAVLIGTVFILLAVLVIPAYGILSALLALEGMALVIGYFWRPRIRFSSPLLDSVLAGDTVTLTYTLENKSRFSAYHLSIALEHLPASIERLGKPVVISCLRGHETRRVTILIRPQRRGHYPIGRLTCTSAFPFSLFSFGQHASLPNELVVLPPVDPLQVQTSSLRRDAWTRGIQVAGQAGASANYIGNRPYVPGDSPRNIDARAWARLSVPAIKEFHEDFILHAGIVLDTHISAGPSADTEIPELEAGIVLAASVGQALHHDYILDLLVTGPEMFELTEGAKLSRFNRLHGILADVQASQERPSEERLWQWAERLGQLHEVVFILQGWRSPLASLLQRLDRMECSRTVVVIGSEERSWPDDVDMTWPGSIHCLTPEMILKQQVQQL